MFILRASIIPDLFVEANGSPWYAQATLILYAVFPYLYFAIYGKADKERSNHVGALVAMGLIAIAFIWYWMLHKYDYNKFGVLDVFAARIPIFILGVWAGKYVKEECRIPAPALIGLALCLLVAWGPFFEITREFWWQRLAYQLLGLFITPLLAFIFEALAHLYAYKVSLGRFMAFSGTLSLELYLAHYVIYWCTDFLPPIGDNFLLATAYIVVSYVLAWGNSRAHVWFGRNFSTARQF